MPPRPTPEPPTWCPLPPSLAPDRVTRADRFARAHPFTDIGADALHTAAVFALEFAERTRLRAMRDFPLEMFAGVHLPGELYGFDRLRADCVRALPFFFLWLGRTGDLTPHEAASLARRARALRRGGFALTARAPGSERSGRL